MMTTTPPILRNCVLAIPVVVLAGVMLRGPASMAGVGVSAVLSVMNLAFLAWVVRGFTASLARDEGGGIFGPIFGSKMFLLLAIGWGLIQIFPPIEVAIGWSSVILGVGLTGVMLAMSDDVSQIAEQES